MATRKEVMANDLPKLLILSSRKNKHQVEKFQMIVNIKIEELLKKRNLDFDIKAELSIHARVAIADETLNLSSVKDNTYQINKLRETQEQHIEYIQYLENYDIIIVYLPLDMRAMFEVGFLYAAGKKLLIFFCDEVVRFNLMYLPSYSVYGSNGELSDITPMLIEAFSSFPVLNIKEDTK